MRKVILAVLLMATTVSFGQLTEKEKRQRERIELPDGWSQGGIFSINGTQTSFTNWNAGGVNSIAIGALMNYNINLKKGLNTWENNLSLAYGMLNQQDVGWIKTDDRIDFTSKYGRQFNDSSAWYSAALINFNTQMTDGFALPNDSVAVSKFLAPGYLLAALGADYKPSSQLSLFIAPVTGKFTFVNDQDLANAGAFGVTGAILDPITGAIVTPGERFRPELGGYLKMGYNIGFMPDTAGVKQGSFTTSLGLFSNYLNNPGNIDVNWETLTQIKLWKAITLTLSTHLIYDDDIDIGFDSNDDGTQDGAGPRTQFKQIFGVGLTFNLGPRKKN
ncbi:MAG: DUF3078 domain-containing protein [Crocinitomicaceae bacterium]|nr:DUF3078 domain-containing protein [Crocinitomicaceae bacterium]